MVGFPSSTVLLLSSYMLSKTLLFLYFCIVGYIPFTVAASYKYEYSANCSTAYAHYMSLHLREGRAAINDEVRTNPYNLMATYIADYEDCTLLMLNVDPLEYEQRKEHFDERIALLEKGEKSSPWYRFCIAGVYLHWAIVHLQFGEQLKATMKFRKSFALIKENQELHPGFEYNSIFTGLQEAVVGSLPGNYKWIASVFGMKGNAKKGTDLLSNFINAHSVNQPLYAETVLFNIYTRFYLLRQQEEMWNFINSSRFVSTGNLLNTYVKANIGLDYRKADEVIQALSAASSDNVYYNYPFFEYQAGIALLSKNDTACIAHFRQYIRNCKSGNYIKDSWQKTGYAYYLAGNMPQASYCREQAGLRGQAKLDADKQAEKFADNNEWPSRQLLSARLYIDGGYYSKAQAMLSSIDPATLTKPADKAEYYFRQGRVYHESGNNTKAIEFYKYTIQIAKDRHEQFAARAALQAGLVYEHLGQKDNAISMYNKCLDMPPHDFQNSIDQQAKAGINRIEGR